MDPRVDAAVRIARDVLSPMAQEVDAAATVPRSSFDELQRAGLYGVGAEPRVLRDVWRVLAGGCGATSFVWVQHHLPTRFATMTSNEPLTAQWRAALQDGTARSGVMFAHLRRPGTPALRATRVTGGWTIDGFAPWASGWGLVDAFGVAAETEDGRIVWFLLPAAQASGLPHQAFDLTVMGSTCTVSVEFPRVHVPDAHILLVQPKAEWRATDELNTLQPPWAALGVAEAASPADRTDNPDDPLADEVQAALARSVQLNDETLAGRADPDALLAFRGEALVLSVRATAAAVARAGGGAVQRSHPAQRQAREALFYLVQQQTLAIRTATLSALTTGALTTGALTE